MDAFKTTTTAQVPIPTLTQYLLIAWSYYQTCFEGHLKTTATVSHYTITLIQFH
jgi:hypothetical protein